jgi:hypothetical protein
VSKLEDKHRRTGISQSNEPARKKREFERTELIYGWYVWSFRIIFLAHIVEKALGTRSKSPINVGLFRSAQDYGRVKHKSLKSPVNHSTDSS